MPIDPSIALQYKAPQFADPMQRMGNFLALQNAGNQNALAQYQLSKAQREDQQMAELVDKVKGMGGPDNLPAIADAMIQTGKPEYIQMGVALKNKLSARAMLAGMGGGQQTPGQQSIQGASPSSGNALTARAGVDPRVPALLSMEDPATTEYAKMLQQVHMEAGKPQIPRGFPIQRINPATGNYEADPSSVSSLLDFERKKKDIEQGFKTGVTKVTVYDKNTGDQYQIELNPTQQAEWQKTGQIPPELLGEGPAPSPAPTGLNLTAPTDAIAKETAFQLSDQGVPSFSVGVGKQNATKPLVVGRGQTQSEGIAQAGQKEAVTKVSEGQAKIFSDHYDSATRGVQALPVIAAAREALDKGAVTGFGASFFLNMNRALSQAGFKASVDATENTQVFASTTARQVLQIIKNLGSGSGISDADREYAAKIIGGDIALDAPAIKRLLQISDLAIRNDVQWVNSQVPKYKKMGAAVDPIDLEQFSGSMTKSSSATPASSPSKAKAQFLGWEK